MAHIVCDNNISYRIVSALWVQAVASMPTSIHIIQ